MTFKICLRAAAAFVAALALSGYVHAASFGTQLSYNPTDSSVPGFDNEIAMATAEEQAASSASAFELQGSEVSIRDGKDAVIYTNNDFKADIFVDNQSTLKLKLENGAHMTGSINTDGTAKSVTLTVARDAQWILTGDSHIMSFCDEDASFKNIDSAGYNIYYGKNASTILGGLTYDLPGGGKLIPQE